MKINKLTMNAFSTYHHLTTIDFEKMIDHGLYLISGPTGSGKTTIFDAITFALYGQASGSERQQAHFRSDYADAKEETYVELTFELHNKVYTVKRSPTYYRQGYKTPKMANAYLTYDQMTIEGVKEVNQKINELLGVDVHQFKQIVMIAQGEFTKLIYASSEEREKVLRHIFHTESIVKFEEMLKEKTKQYKDQYHISSNQIISQYQLLSFSDEFMKKHQDNFHPSYIEEALMENQKMYDCYHDTQGEYQKIQTEYDKLSQEYYQKQKKNQDILEYRNVSLKYQKHLEKQEFMKQNILDIDKLKLIQKNQTMVYQYQTLQTDLKNNDKALTNALSKHQDLQKQSQQIEKEYLQIPKYKIKKEEYALEIQHINDLLKQKETFKRLQKQYNEVQKEHTLKKKEYDQLNEKYITLTKHMERDQENVNRLSALQLQLEQMDQMVKETNQKRISIHDLSDLFDQSHDIQDKHYELSRNYQQRDEEYQSLFKTYHQENENFRRQQAGILAMNLSEGEACPVCGSTHHPQLAKVSSHVLSSSQLEALSKQLEVAKEEKEESYQAVLLENENMRTVQVQIDVYKKQLGIEEELSKEVFIRLLSNVMQITKIQEKTYQKQYTEVQYLKKVKRSLEQNRETVSLQERKLNSLLEDIHELEKQLTALNTQLDSLNMKDVQTDYQKQLLQKQNEYQELEKKIQSIENQYHTSQKNLSLLQQQIQTLEEQKDELNKKYNEMKIKYDSFIRDSFETVESYQYYFNMLDQLNNKEKLYQEYQIEERTLLSQLKRLEKLKELDLIDLSQEEQLLKEIDEKRNALYKDMNQKHVLYQNNSHLLKDIQQTYQQNQDILHQYTLYQDLSDYTSGKNPQRLSFERYVLSTYFENILEYANIELAKMSNGRFALYRKVETKGAKQQGLDLNVLDYETGMMRDVQSLSGGESFKAALSLALGLSSMIQSYAGGIELNTLFIDEGFGSLDHESLDQALAVLLDMKNDNKVIGIISHVSDLKERINTQIIVEKGKNGSLLHIEKDG